MDDNNDRRRKKQPPWWNDALFRGQLEAVKKIVKKLMQRITSSPEDFFGPDAASLSEELKIPVFWGFATIGPDGRVQMNTFGRVGAEGISPTEQGEKEPLIEVADEEDALIIIAELPGVEKKEDIDLTITERKVTIHVDTPRLKYHKDVDLSSPVRPKEAHAHYSNGILEIRLPKK